jgi:polyisoprenoid-binding protein YceI
MQRNYPLMALLLLVFLGAAGAACAASVTYDIDPDHTYPSFEADHLGGLSVWRGKFNHSRGVVMLDKTAKRGSVHIVVDVASIDFGLDQLNAIARGPKLFDAKKYPKAVYDGRLTDFVDGAPTRVVGRLTLHGVTRPLDLTLDSFKCIPDPLVKRERCGADALAHLKRDAFGIDAGKDYGFRMDVTLRIQVEAVAKPDGTAAGNHQML